MDHLYPCSFPSCRGLVRKQVNLDEHDPEECKGVVQPAIGCEQPRFEATGATVTYIVRSLLWTFRKTSLTLTLKHDFNFKGASVAQSSKRRPPTTEVTGSSPVSNI